MPGFDALYKQTVTLFNRVQNQYGEDVMWYPTVLSGVHLITDRSATWNMNGGAAADNVRLHVRYQKTGSGIITISTKTNGVVVDKPYYEPKEYRRLDAPEEAITFAYGNAEVFDFFVEGEFTEFTGAISDDIVPRMGFYNYMNKKYDNVFAITSVSKYNLIPHFEIMAR